MHILGVKVWLIVSSLLLLNVGFAQERSDVVPLQPEIDAAFELIFSSPTGKLICRDILGSNEVALSVHLGISPSSAKKIAKMCESAPLVESQWIYPSSPEFIRKFVNDNGQRHRSYEVLEASINFNIESWTVGQTTSILISPAMSDRTAETWLVKILAHEMAVYFDSKVNFIHPEASEVPALEQALSELAKDPNGWFTTISISDPQFSYAMTFLRALQIEYKIVTELYTMGLIPSLPPEYDLDEIKLLVGGTCRHECILSFIKKMKQDYRDIALPLTAFSPLYRSHMLHELTQRPPRAWSRQDLRRAQEALDRAPLKFLTDQYTGDVLIDLTRVFNIGNQRVAVFKDATRFLNEKLWPLEIDALSQANISASETLLEFLKRPLLSGHNISLSTGPRARIGAGNIE